MYAEARKAQYIENLLYRVYTTDALQKICANTANFAGGHIIKYRYYDAVFGKHQEKEENALDIVNGIIKRGSLEVTL